MDNINKYIVIEGNIGAGKTSLCHKLANALNARLVLEEFEDNPFLPKFYADPERYSFSLELSFLAARYKQLKEKLNQTELFKPISIADYYFIKSLIFAQGTLDEDEYTLYRQIFNITYDQLPKPGLYVYLHQPVEKLLKHIALRGRDYEQNISEDYLLKIQKNYFNFFKTVHDYPIVVVDCSHIDFINNVSDYEWIADLIKNQSFDNGLHHVQP